jgi:hypothetical protein
MSNGGGNVQTVTFHDTRCNIWVLNLVRQPGGRIYVADLLVQGADDNISVYGRAGSTAEGPDFESW